MQGKPNDSAVDGKDNSLSIGKLEEESMGQLGEPVKQNIEVVHDTVIRAIELIIFELFK